MMATGSKEHSTKTKTGLLGARISAFEKAAADATNPEIMAAKISDKSDRKKYNFAQGLKRDLAHTRAALRACSQDSKCTFGHLFEYTEGQIANLNRVLQNLKQAGEVSFAPECFFVGVNDDDAITLLENFWSEEYSVNDENVFRQDFSSEVVPEQDRLGRSYVAENLQTMNLNECTVCSQTVKVEDRITIRGAVFHLKCISCAVCGSSPKQKADFVTFDGHTCCSSDCIAQYDGANVRQQRN